MKVFKEMPDTLDTLPEQHTPAFRRQGIQGCQALNLETLKMVLPKGPMLVSFGIIGGGCHSFKVAENLDLCGIAEAIAGEEFLTRGRELTDGLEICYARLGDRHKDQPLTTKLCDFSLRPGRFPYVDLEVMEAPCAGPTAGSCKIEQAPLFRYGDTLSPDVWVLVARHLLQEPGQGWPPSLWRVGRYLPAVAFAGGRDSHMCGTFRTLLEEAWKDHVTPTLNELLVPETDPSDESAKTDRMNRALGLFLDGSLGPWWEETGRTRNVWPSQPFVYYPFDGEGWTGRSHAAPGLLKMSNITEERTIPWMRTFGGCFMASHVATRPAEPIYVYVWARRDPFGRPHLWVHASLNPWCKRLYVRHGYLLQAGETFSLLVARIARELHGSLELCLFRPYVEEDLGNLRVPNIREGSIIMSITVPHPVTDKSTLVISNEVLNHTKSSNGNFRLAQHSCELGARIFCTDEHESPTGCWAIRHDTKEAEWLTSDPYKAPKVYSCRLATPEEVHASIGDITDKLPAEAQPLGMLITTTSWPIRPPEAQPLGMHITTTSWPPQKDKKEGKGSSPPPRKRVKRE